MAHSSSCLGKQAFSIFFMYNFSYEERKASLLCPLQSYLLGDLGCFSNPVSSGTNKKKKKKHRKKLQNSSSFFNWNQRPNCSIWLHWHLFPVYCSIGSESRDCHVQNSLMLLNSRAVQTAQISQGSRAAPCWASSDVSVFCSWKTSAPGNRVTQRPHQNVWANQNLM